MECPVNSVSVYAVDGEAAPCDRLAVSETAHRLGQVVRTLRQQNGMSQEAFAHAIGVHRTFMGVVERGETNLSLSNLVRIAHGLELRPGDLLNQAVPEEPPQSKTGRGM